MVKVAGGERVATNVVAVKAGVPGTGVIKEEVGHGNGQCEKVPIISAARLLKCAPFFYGVFYEEDFVRLGLAGGGDNSRALLEAASR